MFAQDQPLPQRLEQSRHAAQIMATLSTEAKNAALDTLAQLLASETTTLLAANACDLDATRQTQFQTSLLQRLKLDAAKINTLIEGTRQVIQLPDPAHRVIQRTQLDDGLILEQRTVPLGVIALIFESRPDVLPQVLSLMLKSGNAVVFKGGQEAIHSNRAMMALVDTLTQQAGLPDGWAQLIEGREAVAELLNYPQYVDLIIPRGSNALVQHILANTRIPVLGHADGVCHLYLQKSADVAHALPVILDAKAQYPAACNALETLLIDTDVAETFLPLLNHAAQGAGITLLGCEKTRSLLPDLSPVDDWHTEYGDLTLAIKLVTEVSEAIDHINQYGSHHTDGILASDPGVIEAFLSQVDSASVYANASTRFADGFRYGFGAEIGISTSRTHARGPVGLQGLITTQYRLTGQYHAVTPYANGDRAFQHRVI